MTVAELEAGYPTTRPARPTQGGRYPMLERRAVELLDPEDDEAAAPMGDTRGVERVLQGAVETNLEIRGGTVPHPHPFPRHVGDRPWGRPIDPRGGPLFLGPEGFDDFVAGPRGTLAEEP